MVSRSNDGNQTEGNAMKFKEKITHPEISSALQQFINEGGIINHLPDQEYQMAQMVGEDKYDVYEHLSDLSALTFPEDSPQN